MGPDRHGGAQSLMSERGSTDRSAVSVMALQAQVDALTAERDTLVAENRRLAVYLDDCLDFAQLHALDPANERIAVAAVRAHAKHLDYQYHW
jgi:hypothetical protein